MMQTGFDAVVIGAGVAGSSAAILLARAGWSVALIEKQRFPRRKVCGECIAASNLPLLEALGIGTQLESLAGPELRHVALMRGDREVHAELPAAKQTRHRWGRALGRESLDTLLLEQARRAGAHVMQPWSVQAIHGEPGDWRCDLRALDPTGAQASLASPTAMLTLRCAVVVDAHGSWEALPSGRAQQKRARKPADLYAFKANFTDASLPPGLLPVLALDGGYGGMVLAGGETTVVACCIRSDRLDQLRRAAAGVRAGEVVEAWLRRECGGVHSALSGATRDGPWLASGPIAPGIRLRADDRIFRIGNAAGEAHPILGEGMSMALQSAGLLCAQLIAGGRPLHTASEVVQAEMARRYAMQWHQQFEPRLRLAATFAHLAMRPSTGALLMGLVTRWPGLLTQGARWGGKVRCAADPATFRAPMPVAVTGPAADGAGAMASRAFQGTEATSP